MNFVRAFILTGAKMDHNNIKDQVALIELALSKMAIAFATGQIRPICLLCEKDPGKEFKADAWLMDRHAMDLAGAPENKQRVFPYCVCLKCFELKNRRSLCEQKILQIHHKEKIIAIDCGEKTPIYSPEKRLERMENRKKVSQ